MLQTLDNFRFGVAATLDDITANHAVLVLICCLTIGVCAAAFIMRSIEIKGAE